MKKNTIAVVHGVDNDLDALGNIVKEIAPLVQEFGSGDLNILRDKINEIISAL